MRRFLRVMAALAVSLPMPAAADGQIGVSVYGGTVKQEMQGVGSPHFSLIGPESGLALEWTAPSRDPNAPQIGLRFDHSEQGTLSTSHSDRRWQRGLGRQTATRTDNLTLTATLPLLQTENAQIALRAGAGIARTQVSLQTRSGRGYTTEIVPRAEVALRQSLRDPENGAQFWSEISYHTSPALTVNLSDGSQVRHETSGFQVSIGVALAVGN